MPPEEFARERLGWWEEPTGAVAGLPLNLWEASARKAAAGQLLAIAVDATPDLAFASLATATRVADGILLELVAHRRGTSWVAADVDRLRGETRVPVVVDLGGPASVFHGDLTNLRIDMLNPAARDVAQGCSALLDGLIRRTVWHTTTAALTAAVRGASRRPMGDAWAWSRKNSLVDISPLVAVTLALWGTAVDDVGSVYEERDLVRL